MALIHQKLVEIMRDLKAISKDQKNTFDGYKFRGIDDVLNNLHAPFAKHGVVLLPKVIHRDDYEGKTRKGDPSVRVVLTVEYSFICAEDGSSEKAIVLGEAVDRSDKAINKAMSAALKYLLIQVLLIPVDDIEEADKTSPELPEKKDAATEYFEKIPDTDWDEDLPDFEKNHDPEFVKELKNADEARTNTNASMAKQKITKDQIAELLRVQAAKGLHVTTMRKLVKDAGAKEAKELTLDQYFKVLEKLTKIPALEATQ